MPSAALLLGGGITGGPRLPDVLPFDLGVVNQTAVLPFDILADPVSITWEFPFWMAGDATQTSVLPFDLGEVATMTSTLPWDLLGADDFVLEAVDLGDGESVEATAQPVYGWWEGGLETDSDGLEGLDIEV